MRDKTAKLREERLEREKKAEHSPPKPRAERPRRGVKASEMD
jgi:hypothetical protein